MNHRFVIYSIGKLLQVLAAVMCIPAGIALFEAMPARFSALILDRRLFGFVLAIGLALCTGSALALVRRRPIQGNAVREGFAIVTFGWLVLTFFGCIPLFAYFQAHQEQWSLAAAGLDFTNAFFEIMSGFTTTGATILTDIEVLPKGMLFWRSMTHWLGGMGIVTLALSVFPAFGVTAYQMFRGEVPGPTAERLKPRLAQTAKILWGVYAALTLAETGLLMLGGMSLFESLCHAFGTMATGGFSTRNASIAAYNSDYIDWVIIVFMFLAGTNFMIHYRVIFGRDISLLRADREYRFYVSVLLIAITLGVAVLLIAGPASSAEVARSYRATPLTQQQIEEKIATERAHASSLYQTIRSVTFQVISITTTTGYATADFDIWPTVLRLMLVVLMFFGGSAGSTGGGIKMIRVLVVLRTAWREVKTMIQPRLIAPVKIAGKALEEKQVGNIIAFFTLFIVLFVFFSLVMSFIIGDFTTAVTSVVATLCNIGPGLSGIGATENYAWIPPVGKWILTICMLLGRLEIYTVIIALSPLWWRK